MFTVGQRKSRDVIPAKPDKKQPDEKQPDEKKPDEKKPDEKQPDKSAIKPDDNAGQNKNEDEPVPQKKTNQMEPKAPAEAKKAEENKFYVSGVSLTVFVYVIYSWNPFL